MQTSSLARAIAGLILYLVANIASAQTPQGTAFTYQGELRQNSTPVTASVDMVFELFDAAAGGNPVGSPQNFTNGNGNPVQVQNGIFTVALDFGALAFNTAVSDERYLKVTINGNALAPRTKIENAPYALQARAAELAYSVSNASIGSAQIIAAQVQQRVSGTCSVGSSVQSIAQNGSVTCQTNGGSGTVTSVGSGTGLTGGPITGSGTLAIASGGVGLAQIDSTAVQARVTGSCAAGEKMLSVNANGTVVCGTDATGGTGTVTNVASGTGLTGGPISTSGTLSIANGGVGAAQINSAQVQARVDGTCAVGEYVRGINANGSVVCSPVLGMPRITFLQVPPGTGLYTSIAIGSDGLPVMSYYDSSDTDLFFAHCDNAACTSITQAGMDGGTAVDIGRYTSIAVGSDGLPIVSYYDTTNGNLKVAHCDTAVACTFAIVTTVDFAAGQYTSIAIGNDGLPVVSYYDNFNHDLKVAHCVNVACTGVATITAVDTPGDVGRYTAIAIGVDGMPVVSYQDVSNTTLKVAHCANAACTGTATITTVDGLQAGYNTSIAIGGDGVPVVSYQYADLRVAHCANAACTGSATITHVDKPADTGGYSTSIKVGADGVPVVSYYDGAHLRVAHCANAACTGSAAISAVDTDTASDVGRYSAIAIGADGLPVASYYDSTRGGLKVAKCNNRLCQ